MGVGELDEPELLARVNLEVLAELALVSGGDREGREQLDVDVGLPCGVLRRARSAHRSRAARRVSSGQVTSASRRCRPPRRRWRRARRATPAHGRRRAARGRRRPGAGGQPSSAARAGGMCSRSRARRASRARVARAPRPGRRARRAARGRRRARSRRTPTRKASRRGRPALSHPAAERPTRRSSSASRALNASPSEVVPWKLLAGDLVQLEQAA